MKHMVFYLIMLQLITNPTLFLHRCAYLVPHHRPGRSVRNHHITNISSIILSNKTFRSLFLRVGCPVKNWSFID